MRDSILYYSVELDFIYIAKYYNLEKNTFSSIADAVENEDHWLRTDINSFLHWFGVLVKY